MIQPTLIPYLLLAAHGIQAQPDGGFVPKSLVADCGDTPLVLLQREFRQDLSLTANRSVDGSLLAAKSIATAQEMQSTGHTGFPDVLGKITKVANKVTKVANKISKVANKVAGVLNSLKKISTPHSLGGHTTSQINSATCGVILIVVVPTALSLMAEVALKPKRSFGSRTPLWAITMLLMSYLLLIPGLSEVLFSFLVQIKLLGLKITVTAPQGTQGAITESMWQAAQELWRTGSKAGYLLVILYAVVMPCLKFVLLAIGEILRNSSQATCLKVAWYCIRTVQLISKWACPDMFAYILLLYLLRSLGERSGLLDVQAQLDYGFVCFSVFCMASTVSSMALPLPHLKTSDSSGSNQGVPISIRWFGCKGLLWITALLSSGMMLFFIAGLLVPCMALEIKPEFLVKPYGPLPKTALPSIRALKLESQINSNVSVWQCITALWRWLSFGEATSVIAFLMLFLFATVFTVVDVVLLNAAAFKVGSVHPDVEKGR